MTPAPDVRLVATDETLEFIRERGGRLYVWTKTHRCCHGGLTLVESATAPPAGRGFRVVARDGIEVYVPDAQHTLPSELHIEVRRFPRKRIEAYWDGCAWVA